VFVVTVRFTVNVEHAAAFAAAVAEQARNSLEHETGCLLFDVCRNGDDARVFFLYEKYANRAAFDAHLNTPHFLDFDTRVSTWVAEKRVETWGELRHST